MEVSLGVSPRQADGSTAAARAGRRRMPAQAAALRRRRRRRRRRRARVTRIAWSSPCFCDAGQAGSAAWSLRRRAPFCRRWNAPAHGSKAPPRQFAVQCVQVSILRASVHSVRSTLKVSNCGRSVAGGHPAGGKFGGERLAVRSFGG
eukprot:gene13620-biopygen10415